MRTLGAYYFVNVYGACVLDYTRYVNSRCGSTISILAFLLLFHTIINPRRTCAARVTVLSPCVSLSVCVSVCLSTFVLELCTTRQLMNDIND